MFLFDYSQMYDTKAQFGLNQRKYFLKKTSKKSPALFISRV